MDEREQLEQAIAELEAKRAILGDVLVDTLLAPAREKLAALLAKTAGDLQAPAPAIAQHFDQSRVGINIGSSSGTVIVPLFTGEGGTFFADVINLYGPPTSPQTDYAAALRRYLEHLYSRHATLDLRGIDDRPMDMPLHELYVSLTLHEPSVDVLRGRGGLRRFVEGMRGRLGNSPQCEDAAEERVLDEGGRLNWVQALRHPALVVIGVPGCGKTTLLQWTAVRLAEIVARDQRAQLAELGLSDPPPVPLLLPLRHMGSYLQECGPRELSDVSPKLLLDCLSHYYAGFQLDLPADFFMRLCESGRAMLLLDGLDEVARSEDRVLVSGIVRECALRYPRCRYVVTARVAAYQGDVRIGTSFRVCTVADLSEEQQQTFITNWSLSLQRLLHPTLPLEQQEHAARSYSKQLWCALQMNQRVLALATNPLLLTVIAVIYYNNYVLPEDRAALYEESVEVLLRGGRGKADRAGQQRGQYLDMGPNAKREVLAAVAYAMHERGADGQIIEREELIARLHTILTPRFGAAATEAARLFVDELPVHMGVLDEVQPERFRFSHLSFQEFLAARYVAESDRWDELIARFEQSWWREVILLCAGYLSQERCWRFLERLIDRRSRNAEQQVLALELAAAALKELERFKGEGPLATRIRHQALDFLAAPPGALPLPCRIRTGFLLGQLGDPRFPTTIDAWRYELERALTRAETGYFCLVEAGDYLIGSDDDDPDGEEYEKPRYTLRLAQPLLITRYPITNAQWQAWVEAGGPASYYGDAPDLNQRNQPVVGVSWYMANDYCDWLTGQLGVQVRLPTEAEWEAAARGRDGRRYPWGNTWQPESAATEMDRGTRGWNRTVPVGCYPGGAAPCGALDMAGNVWEWTADSWRSYPGTAQPFEDEHLRVLRGGSYKSKRASVRCGTRFWDFPDNGYFGIGLRVLVAPRW